jgi:predicted GNAT superfamily acetyltransferase
VVPYSSHLKTTKHEIKYSRVSFNFKTKQVEFGEEMSAEIMANKLVSVCADYLVAINWIENTSVNSKNRWIATYTI